ncbi:MAG TPA: DNA topoisomerase IV, partial [Pseudomonas sp.]|nr:DNA topoisomerase IV [Pseudomonas sp.]
MIRDWLLAALLLAATAPALGLEQLRLLAEHPVDGVPRGNLSGLAWCGDGFWTVSDRADDRLYRLKPGARAWLAEEERFHAPPPPPSGLPWGLRQSQRLIGWVRGGMLDFEGITCDGSGNRYLLSESTLGVLMIPPVGPPHWLKLPPALVRQARGAGLLQR